MPPDERALAAVAIDQAVEEIVDLNRQLQRALDRIASLQDEVTRLRLRNGHLEEGQFTSMVNIPRASPSMAALLTAEMERVLQAVVLPPALLRPQPPSFRPIHENRAGPFPSDPSFLAPTNEPFFRVPCSATNPPTKAGGVFLLDSLYEEAPCEPARTIYDHMRADDDLD